MTESPPSLVEYYRRNRFNPVPIAIEDRAVWEDHFDKRRNLYQRHLGIAPALLRGARVLEYGCNSGENALVLAAAGADLTLVEPNEQVLPRLRELFDTFQLDERIVDLRAEEMGAYQPGDAFDIVVAEGFLFALPDRDALLAGMARALVPGGLGILSFNDRYGILLEQARRLLLFRACELAGIVDLHGDASLALARRLFADDFARLSTSRAFEVWWKDTLVNPFLEARFLWSTPEILDILGDAGCAFHAASPPWARGEQMRWYKDVAEPAQRRQRLLDDWARALPWVLTGLAPEDGPGAAPPAAAPSAIADLVTAISGYTDGSGALAAVHWPATVDALLRAAGDTRLERAADEFAALFDAVHGTDADAVVDAYHRSSLRRLWGAPYHYLCFVREAP